LPPSSFLSWWVLALSCWCKVDGDKRVRQKIDLARRRQTGCLDQRGSSGFGKSTAGSAGVAGFDIAARGSWHVPVNPVTHLRIAKPASNQRPFSRQEARRERDPCLNFSTRMP
jgi:hypothetical protein